MELDTHADTCALGDACLVLGDTGETVDVGGFGDGVGVLKDVSIVHGAVAYDCPLTSKTYLLIYHQALRVPGMEVHLLNPFQMREQGLTVNDIPLQQLDKESRTKHSHSIVHQEPDLHIPLSIQGTMSGFTVRKPTWDEVNDDDKAIKVHMTSHAKWIPNSRLYQEIEQTLRSEVDRDIILPPRDVSTLRARGPDEPSTVAAEDVADNPTTLHVPAVKTYSCYKDFIDSGDKWEDNDGTVLHSSEKQVSLRSLMQREGFKGVLEVDEYAAALMEELGVKELSLEEVVGAELAMAQTKKRGLDMWALRHWPRIGRSVWRLPRELWKLQLS